MADYLDHINATDFKMWIRMGTPQYLDGENKRLLWGDIIYISDNFSEMEDLIPKLLTSLIQICHLSNKREINVLRYTQETERHSRGALHQVVPLKADFGWMQGFINGLENGYIPVISQLQDEVLVLVQEKLNNIIMEELGIELQ